MNSFGGTFSGPSGKQNDVRTGSFPAKSSVSSVALNLRYSSALLLGPSDLRRATKKDNILRRFCHKRYGQVRRGGVGLLESCISNRAAQIIPCSLSCYVNKVSQLHCIVSLYCIQVSLQATILMTTYTCHIHNSCEKAAALRFMWQNGA